MHNKPMLVRRGTVLEFHGQCNEEMWVRAVQVKGGKMEMPNEEAGPIDRFMFWFLTISSAFIVVTLVRFVWMFFVG